MYLYPYKNGSASCKALASELGIKQIKREGSKYKGSPNKLVINWGSTTMSEEASKCVILNRPEAVRVASDKLLFFRAMKLNNDSATTREQLISYPQYTERQSEALRWVRAGYTAVARTILNGHSGAGIVLIEEEGQFVQAPLYVFYQPKKQEYRVHVLNGSVVDVQRKARRTDIPDDQVNWKIRNHDNGFIYIRDEAVEKVSSQVLTNAKLAVKICGLDFGAVDIIFNEKNDKAYVLEVNTAPGLTGETLAGYTERFTELEKVFKSVKPKDTNRASNFRARMDAAIANLDEHNFGAIPVPRARV